MKYLVALFAVILGVSSQTCFANSLPINLDAAVRAENGDINYTFSDMSGGKTTYTDNDGMVSLVVLDQMITTQNRSPSGTAPIANSDKIKPFLLAQLSRIAMNLNGWSVSPEVDQISQLKYGAAAAEANEILAFYKSKGTLTNADMVKLHDFVVKWSPDVAYPAILPGQTEATPDQHIFGEDNVISTHFEETLADTGSRCWAGTNGDMNVLLGGTSSGTTGDGNNAPASSTGAMPEGG